MRSLKIIGVGLALTLLVGACSDDDSDDSASDTSTVEEVATPQLTFDGTDCTCAGPAEVTNGIVVVEFVNTSGDGANVGVAKLDEGYTVADVVVFLDESTAAALPPWATGNVTVPPADPGETIAWEGDLDAGEYVLACTQSSVTEVGAGLTVVEG